MQQNNAHSNVIFIQIQKKYEEHDHRAKYHYLAEVTIKYIFFIISKKQCCKAKFRHGETIFKRLVVFILDFTVPYHLFHTDLIIMENLLNKRYPLDKRR